MPEDKPNMPNLLRNLNADVEAVRKIHAVILDKDKKLDQKYREFESEVQDRLKEINPAPILRIK
jgi:hypothetical protein